jgi:hypothetical protein
MVFALSAFRKDREYLLAAGSDFLVAAPRSSSILPKSFVGSGFITYWQTMFLRILQFLGFQSVPPSQTRRAATGGSVGRENVTVTHERVLGTSPPPQSPESSRAAQLLKDAMLMKKSDLTMPVQRCGRRSPSVASL